MDDTCEYRPGVRLYFDASAIACDGLLVRDGGHYKVRDQLYLKYALYCATLDNVDMQGKPITPSNFAYRADETFDLIYPNRLKLF